MRINSCGERNGQSKLTADQVREIRARIESGETTTALAPIYGVGRYAIRDIKEGRSWGWLE